MTRVYGTNAAGTELLIAELADGWSLSDRVAKWFDCNYSAIRVVESAMCPDIKGMGK